MFGYDNEIGILSPTPKCAYPLCDEMTRANGSGRMAFAGKYNMSVCFMKRHDEQTYSENYFRQV